MFVLVSSSKSLVPATVGVQSPAPTEGHAITFGDEHVPARRSGHDRRAASNGFFQGPPQSTRSSDCRRFHHYGSRGDCGSCRRSTDYAMARTLSIDGRRGRQSNRVEIGAPGHDQRLRGFVLWLRGRICPQVVASARRWKDRGRACRQGLRPWNAGRQRAPSPHP